MTGRKFERRAAMATLLANRPDNLFVVPGLGSCTWDTFAAGDDDRNFYLWGAMGGAAMVGLGLALAQPKLRVAVVTGDGEMLMGLGSLATIGVQRPANLAVVVFDNGRYGETGMQASHTSNGVDLCAAARGCGIPQVLDIADETGLHELAGLLGSCDSTLFARVPIAPDDPPRALPEKDGVVIKERVRRAVSTRVVGMPASQPSNSSRT
jgi:thiamine pyrophosphate-dependent acetolactate synthase large subunit-like protein